MSDLKISIIGYGKMGKEIETLSSARGIEVASIIDPVTETLSYRHKYRAISKESVKNADVCIDFTTPDAVLDNIRKLARLKKNIVVGTTGWYEHLDEIRELVQSSGIGLIYSPNFSPGVNIFFRIVEFASRNLGSRGNYDIYGHELHHREKQDSPSGTARMLEKIIKNACEKEISFSSTRAGHILGTHIIGFDSAHDSIELKHIAKDRTGFAHGALLAAEFIRNKRGLYNQRDFADYLTS